MATERVYNIPLRKEWLKAPMFKRTNKAVKAVREFLQKHMKSEDVRIGRHLNEQLWERGIKRPPHHVKVNVVKDDEGIVRAELVGHKIQQPKEKEAKKGRLEGLKEKLTGTTPKTQSKSNEKVKKEEKSTQEVTKDASPKKEEKKEAQKEEKQANESKATDKKAQ